MKSEKEVITIYQSILGGKELLDWMGGVPSFHDGEIVSLSLHRRLSSFLQVTGCQCVQYGSEGTAKVIKRAVVTFELKGICYLKLDGFSHQNVIDYLDICRKPNDTEVSPYYDFNATDNDFEIELGPCFGLDGLIRCNDIAITFKQGEPEDALIERTLS